MTTGVYQITCKANGRRYIGSSCDIESRWAAHRSESNHDKHPNGHLQNAWNKYGEDLFRFEILETCESGQEKTQEQKYLDIFKPEFNIAKDACGFSKGHTMSLEHRAKLLAANKGRKQTPGNRAKLLAANKGRKFTPEHRAKMSAANKGRKFTPEHRAKISATSKGRKHTPETCAKISANHKGWKGKKLTSEHKAKISAAQQKIWTPERRTAQAERMRQANAQRKAEKINADG